MSQNVPNMLESTFTKIREMVDVNTVIGDPINLPDGITIIPISKISCGFGGAGMDYVSKNVNKFENPFGGGAGGGIKVTPIAFMIIKDGLVRMLPVATPANTATDRLVEQIPEFLDRITHYIDAYIESKSEKGTELEKTDE